MITSPANIYLEELSGAEGYVLSVDSNGDLNFHNSGAAAPAVTFADDDNVGIGIATPQAQLHVHGTIHQTSIEYPSIRPTLDLNFAATKVLDDRITFKEMALQLILVKMDC